MSILQSFIHRFPRRIGRYFILIVVFVWPLLLLAACQTEEGDGVESDTADRTVTVNGTGQIEAQPDVTLVMFGFWVKEEDANLAIANSAARMDEITAELNTLGIDSADIDSPGAMMNSEQIIGPDGYPTERLLYAVNQNLTITVRDPSKVGDILNSIRVTAGAPYLFGLNVQPELSEERQAQLLAEAQRLALTHAQTSGQVLAQALGLALGQALEVTVLNDNVNLGPILEARVSLQVRYALVSNSTS